MSIDDEYRPDPDSEAPPAQRYLELDDMSVEQLDEHVRTGKHFETPRYRAYRDAVLSKHRVRAADDHDAGGGEQTPQDDFEQIRRNR